MKQVFDKSVEECPFCDTNKIKSEILLERLGVIVFEPINPVTKGHVLVLPKNHVADFAAEGAAEVMSQVCMVAEEWVREKGGDYNLITSKGKSATQSVFHLHIHLVPRKKGDGLLLPWDTKKAKLALIDAEIEMLNKEMSIEGKYDGAADRDHIKGHHKALTDHITYLKEQREIIKLALEK